MTSTIPRRSRTAGLAVMEAGKGHPVLLLHGVGLRAEAWQHQFAALSATYHVIAPDLPGHGASPRLSSDVTLDDFSKTLGRILGQLCEPALVVGHSMGAMIALQLAQTVPDKVAGVAALNAIYNRSPQAARAVQSRAASLDGVTVPNPDATLARWFGDAASESRTACEVWLRDVDPAGYKTAYMAFAKANGPRPDTLSALTCPACFMTGALEPNSTPEMSRAMAGLVPKGQVIIIEGAAHMMPLTHAGAVNTALLALAQEVWP